MKKTSIIVHQRYIDHIIKKLHETGLMEIIKITKEQPDILEETEVPVHSPEASVCANYELRLSRLIDILNKIRPKKSGIKSLIKPELPEVRQVEDRSLDEIYSNSEGVLAEIENQIIDYNSKYSDLNGIISQTFSLPPILTIMGFVDQVIMKPSGSSSS